MSGRPIALRGHEHVCPVHGGGPIVQTQSLVKVDDILVAVVDNLCECASGGMDPIVEGSSVVSIEGKPVARLGDHTAHGGVIVQGETYVIVE